MSVSPALQGPWMRRLLSKLDLALLAFIPGAASTRPLRTNPFVEPRLSLARIFA
jgi:hypothetical protein